TTKARSARRSSVGYGSSDWDVPKPARRGDDRHRALLFRRDRGVKSKVIPLDLSGKVALVTGGSQGLGAATARVLAQAGAAVVVNHYPDPQQERQARQLVEALSGGAALPADVSRP